MPRVSRSPRNSIKDRPRRALLLLRRQRGHLRLIGVAAAGILVLLGLSAVLHAAAPASSLIGVRERLGSLAALGGFRIEHVVVRGRQHTPLSLIHAALGIEKGAPTFGFSLSEARRRVESLTWVRSAVIERRLPGTIVVAITERQPFAIWQNDGRFVVIDRRGDTVAGHDARRFRNLPLVVGPGAPERAAALLDTLSRLPALQKRIAAAVRVGRLRWNLVLKDGTTVMLPDGHADVALARLAALEAKYALLERPLAVVDLRLADRLVLRPWPEHSALPGTTAPPITGGRG